MIEPKTICPGCHRTIVPRGERCAKCKPKQHRGTSRNRPGDPFYSSPEWRALRAERLAIDPCCCCDDCIRTGDTVAADCVDHIKPRREYPELELEITNTRSMATRHHNRHTARTRHTPPGG